MRGGDGPAGGGGMSAQTQQAPASAALESQREGRQIVDKIIRARELSLLGVLVLLVLGTTLVNSRFLNSQNVRDILLNVAIVALLAVGETVVGRHAQHRPVGRLRAGDQRVPHRRAVRRPPRGHRVRVRGRDPVRRAVRADQRRDGRARPRALAGHHARHALRDPGDRLPVGQGPADQRRSDARQLPQAGRRHRARHPGARADHRRGDADRRRGDAQLAHGPRALRDRLQPGCGQPRRDPGRPAG